MKRLLIALLAVLALSAGAASSAQASGYLSGIVLWNQTSPCSTCNGIVVYLANPPGGSCTVGHTDEPNTNTSGSWSDFVPTPCNFRVYGRSKTAVNGCYWYTDYQDFYYGGSPYNLYTGARILNHRACMSQALGVFTG